MTAAKPEAIKTRTIVLVIVLYTLLTNLSDVKTGFIAGWNAVKISRTK